MSMCVFMSMSMYVSIRFRVTSLESLEWIIEKLDMYSDF